MKKSVTLLSSLLFSTFSFAGAGFYAELSVGQADSSVESVYSFSESYTFEGITTNDIGSESETTSLGKSTSFGLRLGYQFNNYIALELGHHEYGEVTTNYTDAWQDEITDTVNSSATSLGVKAILPISDSFALFARGGYAKWDLQMKSTDSSVPGEVFSGSEDDNDIYYGLGAEFNLTESISLGLEYSIITMSWGLDPFEDDFNSEDFSYSISSNVQIENKVENLSLLFKYTF